MERGYAVVWSANGETSSGRLEVLADRLELYGRDCRQSVRFDDLTCVAIARRPADRLLGLPVLALSLGAGAPMRIASLEGAGSLRELAERVERLGGCRLPS